MSVVGIVQDADVYPSANQIKRNVDVRLKPGSGGNQRAFALLEYLISRNVSYHNTHQTKNHFRIRRQCLKLSHHEPQQLNKMSFQNLFQRLRPAPDAAPACRYPANRASPPGRILLALAAGSRPFVWQERV